MTRPREGVAGRLADTQENLAVGKLVGAGLLTIGRIFYAKKSDDRDHADFVRDIPPDRRFSTIQDAVAKCRSGVHDYVLVCPADNPGATQVDWLQTTDIDLLGRYIHLVGIAAGPRRPIIKFDDAHCVDIGNGALTADRTHGIELANLRIVGGGTTVVQCILNGDSNGYTEDTWIHDCKIENLGTTAAVAEIQDYGDDLLVERCTIGHVGTHPDDNYKQLTGAGAATFKDCIFLHKAAAAGDQFASIVATGIPVIFQDCVFYNAAVGTTAMTEAINAAAGSDVLALNCGFIGATVLGTTANTWVAPSGIGLTIAGTEVFNPALAVDGAEPVASDT